MDMFNVYIISMKRSNNAKIDYSILFEKNNIIWYRFAKKTIDDGLGLIKGYLEAVRLAINFSKEHNLYIKIYCNQDLILPGRLENKINSSHKSTKKFKTEYCKEYVKFMDSNMSFYDIEIIKTTENPYYKYGSRIMKTKFRSIHCKN